jgi:hypothetical protein|tara:strand:+ start:1126 stop:1293 length:168 start_codon:yes stop_codon:yes gene_type:complete
MKIQVMPRSARNLKTKVYLDLEQAFRQMVQNYMADKILALMIVAASPLNLYNRVR